MSGLVERFNGWLDRQPWMLAWGYPLFSAAVATGRALTGQVPEFARRVREDYGYWRQAGQEIIDYKRRAAQAASNAKGNDG